MIGDGPSRTALVVAGGVAYAAGDPQLKGLVEPEAAKFTRRMLQYARPRLLRLIDSPLGRWAIRTLERWTIPGIIRHWNCRKVWLAQAWESARHDNFDTLVILGSGFDTLSLRVAQSAGGAIQTIDVDHPATLRARQSAVSDFSHPSHTFIAHDLGHPDVGETLRPAISNERSVFVVIEGVLMYLEPERVEELFRELAAMQLRNLRIAFSFMERLGDAPPAFRPRSRLVDIWLGLRREPFRSGLDPKELNAWLRKLGYQLLKYAASPDDAPTTDTKLRGEGVALADRVE